MTTHPDDLALVERIVGGDEEAAEAFGCQYQKRLAYLARRAGVPRQDCEDVAQEVWLAAVGQIWSLPLLTQSARISIITPSSIHKSHGKLKQENHR
ncbi:MAG: RNA polymerase sigma factor [Blastocatellia bacterium]